MFGGGEGGVRFGEVDAGGDAVGDGDDGDAGGAGGDEAVVGIFNDEGVFGVDFETAESFLEEVGGGFDSGGVATADDGFEVFKEGEFFEPAVDPIVAGGGDDGEAEGVFLGEFDAVADAGEGVEFFDLGFDVALALGVDPFPVEFFAGKFFEIGLGGEVLKVTADAADVGLEFEDVAGHAVELLVGLVDGPFGVDDDAVEVEEEGFDHYKM